MMKLKIRLATIEDLPQILALYKQTALDDGRHLPLGEASRILKLINSYPNYGVYVGLQENQVVGTFALLIMDNLAHKGARSGILEAVSVSPQWQGKGIGRRMMEFAMQRCRASGCYKLMLSTNKRRVGAQRFYEKMGFEHHGLSYGLELKPK